MHQHSVERSVEVKTADELHQLIERGSGPVGGNVVEELIEKPLLRIFFPFGSRSQLNGRVIK